MKIKKRQPASEFAFLKCSVSNSGYFATEQKVKNYVVDSPKNVFFTKTLEGIFNRIDYFNQR